MAAVKLPGRCLERFSPELGRARPRARVAAVSAVLLVAGLTVGGCSKDVDAPLDAGASSPSADPAPSLPASPSEPPAPYLPVPAAVTLTAPGSALRVGEQASLAWELPGKATQTKGAQKKGAQKKSGKKGKKAAKAQVGVVDLKVTAIEAATLKDFTGWQLDKQARASNPFFVRVAVKNVGRTNLSGIRMPLYIVDGNNTLIQMSTFDGDFKPCASTPLPTGFKPGARTKLCLVYLSPAGGRLTAVSFRPTRTFLPITWTGDISRYEGKKDKKKSKKQ